ncbi:hypothetical protein [Vreelandella massiliensis]|uniref:hypothetical protein n=1 Tax=Vreelandella massiliensis TaxID=1816686 RepID=UPI00096A954F|nr:hypothetical protein [Halomonas massiliensis]
MAPARHILESVKAIENNDPTKGEAASYTDDVDLLKSAALSVLAGVYQMRSAALPPMTTPALSANPPFGDWPSAFQHSLVLGEFEVLEDFLHLDVCIAPFWPVGNAGCPLYRIASVYDAVRSIKAVEYAFTTRRGPPNKIEDAGSQRIIERAYERMALLPKDTFLFWQPEAKQLADTFAHEQQERLHAHEKRAEETMRHPVGRRLHERLVAALSDVPYLLDQTVPDAAWQELDTFAGIVGTQRVADMVESMTLPTSPVIWETMVDTMRKRAETELKSISGGA